MARLIKLGGGLLDSGNLGAGEIKRPEGIILLDTGTSDKSTGTTIIMRPNNGLMRGMLPTLIRGKKYRLV